MDKVNQKFLYWMNKIESLHGSMYVKKIHRF